MEHRWILIASNNEKTGRNVNGSNCRAKRNNALSTIKLLIQGFTGSLKGWWDNNLREIDRQTILTFLKQEVRNNEQGEPETIQIDQQVEALIFSISQAFVGDANVFADRSLEILNNLYCPTLGEFRWYKDNFLAKIYTITDCRHSYWKDRFISGLPKNFAQKVRTKTKNEYPETPL